MCQKWMQCLAIVVPPPWDEKSWTVKQLQEKLGDSQESEA